MALGPDPYRDIIPDPEAEPEDYRRGDSLGDLRSTRLGLPTWAVTLVILAVFLLFLILIRRTVFPG